jgi:GTP pyrophosphokinase
LVFARGIEMTGEAITGARLTGRFEEAVVYAIHVHGGQKRKGTGIPYVSHLLGVAGSVLDAGGDEDQAIAALLHDAVEDQGGEERLTDIQARFGAAVGAIVDACSDSKTSDPGKKAPWPERKRAYLRDLRQVPSQALLVSVADKLNNAQAILRDYRELGEALWARFNAGRDEILWYYRSLVEIYRERAAPLTEELAFVVAALEAEVRSRSR